jgi:hypothetical protein
MRAVEEQLTDREPATPKPKRRKVRLRVSRRSVPWVLVALTTAAAIVFAVLWQQAETTGSSADRGRAAVVSAATDFANALTNFKASTIEQDVHRIRSFAVSDFAQQVDQLFSPAIIQALQKAKVESVGQVQSVFVESVDGPQASAFAVVQETRTKPGSPPQSETLRMDIQMLDTKDGWKVSNLNLLQTPSNASPVG